MHTNKKNMHQRGDDENSMRWWTRGKTRRSSDGRSTACACTGVHSTSFASLTSSWIVHRYHRGSRTLEWCRSTVREIIPFIPRAFFLGLIRCTCAVLFLPFLGSIDRSRVDGPFSMSCWYALIGQRHRQLLPSPTTCRLASFLRIRRPPFVPRTSVRVTWDRPPPNWGDPSFPPSVTRPLHRFRPSPSSSIVRSRRPPRPIHPWNPHG